MPIESIIVNAGPNGAPAAHAHGAGAKKHKPKWMKHADKFMDSGETQLFLGVLLLLSLFLADAWILGNAPDSQDDGMFSVLMFVVIIFTGEVVVLSVVAEGYFNSFFFWMDTLGTISILLDIGWISNSLMGGASVRRGSVLRATRAAKLGARYGRILRLMKLMKLTRWCPCFKSNVAEDIKAEPTLSAVVKISNELTSTISRMVALLVVLIVIVVPFLSYSVTDFSPDAWMTVIKTTAKRPNCTSEELDHFVRKFVHFYAYKDYMLHELVVQSPYIACGGTYNSSGFDLGGTQTTNSWTWNNGNREVTKQANLLPYWNDFDFDGQEYKVRAEIDATIPNMWTSLFGIILMILVIGVLFGFSAAFHISIESLVVVPLQKLMSTLRKSATVMIDSLKSLEKEKKVEEKAKAAADGKKIEEEDDDDSDEEDDEDVEAAMLENLVEKLSKIVKHVLPANNDIVAQTDGIDKGTADWLNQQYTSGNNNQVENTRANKMVRRHSKMGGFGITPAAIGLKADGGEKAALSPEEQEELQRDEYIKARTLTVSKIATPAKINSYNFDVLTVPTNEECTEVMHYIFDVVLGFMEEFTIPSDVFYNFCGELCKRYINTNTYHNYKHAVDVAHTSYRLLMTSELSSKDSGGSGVLSNLELMSLLVAALGHDVGHMAVNNGFLVKTKHALAFQHNDKSPLENMHCVVLYEILSQVTSSEYVKAHRSTGDTIMRQGGNLEAVPEGENASSESSKSVTSSTRSRSAANGSATNIFVNLTEAQWRESRKVILNCILGTDMVHHFEQVKKTQLFNDIHNEAIMNYYSGESDTMECFVKDGNNRLFVMELVLHCSDISNPFKPFDICAKWADLVMAEFFQQGDRERALGFDISPGFDRTTTNVFNMQMGFIEFVVQPLVSAVITIFPPLTEIGDNMLNNFLSWGGKRIAEIKADDNITPENRPVEAGKIEERLNKFKAKMAFLDTCRSSMVTAKAAKKKKQEQEEASLSVENAVSANNIGAMEIAQ